MRAGRAGLPVLPTLALAACAGAGLRTPGAVEPYFVAGYHAYWAGDAWVGYPLELLDEVYFFELEVDGRGELAEPHGWPERWGAMVASLRAAEIQVTPTVSQHDPEAFRMLFSDPAAVGHLVDNVMALLEGTPDAAGIHLDFEVFEPMPPEARDGFTAFVAALERRLRRSMPDRSLSLFVLAFDDDDSYDERALVQLADYIVLQGYDYHSLGSETAGPVAPVDGWERLSWTSVVDRFLALGIPAERIVMAVPLYGYEWPVADERPGSPTRGPAVPVPLTAPPDVLPELPRARERSSVYRTRRDEASGSPWYAYESDDGWWQGWFEDEESLAAKLAFVRSRGLGGIAFFPLAYGDSGHWSVLRRALVGPSH